MPLARSSEAPNRAIVAARMLDTHAIARALIAADFTPAQADALTDAVRQATEHDDARTAREGGE